MCGDTSVRMLVCRCVCTMSLVMIIYVTIVLQNFGLDTNKLLTLIGDCPLPLYDLATRACNMDPDKR